MKMGLSIYSVICTSGLIALMFSPCVAQEERSPLAGPAELLHQKTTVPPAADFVRTSRPPNSELNYIPTGSERPQPARPIMNPDQVKAMELELDALRGKHDKASGRKVAPQATKSVTGGDLRPQPSKVGANGARKCDEKCVQDKSRP
jgi:hypothetical protein